MSYVEKPMLFLVIDDHPLMRLGVHQILASRWPQAEVEEAESLRQGLEFLEKTVPDLVLLDLHLPDSDGVEGPVRVLRRARQVPVLVVSSGAEAAFGVRLLQLGVRGYLNKDLAPEHLLAAVERILSGGRYVSPDLADQLLSMMEAGSPGDAGLPHEALSVQEFRVMQLIAQGRSMSEIAELMHMSVKTVGTYRARILSKTGWTSTVDLIKYCLRHGLTPEL